MKQAQIMLAGEGDAWLARNRKRLGQHDPVCSLMEEMKIAPRSALEIGCSNGWRLDRLADRYHCHVMGIDPSERAVRDAASRGLHIRQGVASGLPFVDRRFDLIIFAFCLYLSDPEDWLRIVAESDRVLEDNGILIIHDFFADDGFHGVPYEHCEGVTSWHFDFARLWLAHPLYTMLRRQVHGDDAVTILRKRPRP